MVNIIRILAVIIFQNVGIPLMLFTESQPKDVTVIQKASNKKIKFRLEKLCSLNDTRGTDMVTCKPLQFFIPWPYRMETGLFFYYN